jgi:hypothetical protein
MYSFAVLCEYNAIQDALLALASAQSGLEQWDQAVHTLQMVILSMVYVQYHYSCTCSASSVMPYCSINRFRTTLSVLLSSKL